MNAAPQAARRRRLERRSTKAGSSCGSGWRTFGALASGGMPTKPEGTAHKVTAERELGGTQLDGDHR